MSEQYLINSKISGYVKRLDIMYRSNDQKIFHEIIRCASIFIQENISYDSWDGGTTGHGIVLFLDEEIMEKIADFKTQREICEKLTSDFSECSQSLPNEFIQTVSIELFDESNPECKLSFKPLSQTIINPDKLNIWEPGYIRLFISHRDEFKKEASELAELLEGYGITSFVAHDNIEPMDKWKVTIRSALNSMEIMLVFITDDFFKSCWTNQEIGVALQSGVPIISLKLQSEAPQGFIDDIQAITSSLDSPKNSLDQIYRTLKNKLGKEERIRKSIVQTFIKSPNFNETQTRFGRLQSLETITDVDIQQIIEGYSQNNQLYECLYLHNEKNQRLIDFLKNRTGKDYQRNGKHIKLIKNTDNEEIPF